MARLGSDEAGSKGGRRGVMGEVLWVSNEEMAEPKKRARKEIADWHRFIYVRN